MEATTVTLADLWPIMATLVGSMLALAVAIMRFQNNSLATVSNKIDDSGRESRELIKENRELIERSNRENRELIEKVYSELAGGLAEVRSDLTEVRERLAHIEGYLKPSPLPPPDDDDAPARAA